MTDRDIALKGKIENTSYYGELTTFYVNIDGVNRTIIASSQRFDHTSFGSNDCFLGINFEDINLLTKE